PDEPPHVLGRHAPRREPPPDRRVQPDLAERPVVRRCQWLQPDLFSFERQRLGINAHRSSVACAGQSARVRSLADKLPVALDSSPINPSIIPTSLTIPIFANSSFAFAQCSLTAPVSPRAFASIPKLWCDRAIPSTRPS